MVSNIFFNTFFFNTFLLILIKIKDLWERLRDLETNPTKNWTFNNRELHSKDQHVR